VISGFAAVSSSASTEGVAQASFRVEHSPVLPWLRSGPGREALHQWCVDENHRLVDAAAQGVVIVAGDGGDAGHRRDVQRVWADRLEFLEESVRPGTA
jgi:hypothetical protein